MAVQIVMDRTGDTRHEFDNADSKALALAEARFHELTGKGFRAVALGGRVSDRPLADESAARVVKRYASRVGLEASTFSGHSLRSGFLTSAAESGANVFKMAEVSRHRSLDTLRGYVRRVDLFKEHAGAAFL